MNNSYGEWFAARFWNTQGSTLGPLLLASSIDLFFTFSVTDIANFVDANVLDF